MLVNLEKKLYYKNILFISTVIILLLAIITNPSIAISSARSGLNSWFNILLPSLFPFMILSDILLYSGMVDHFGSFLNPLTRFFFNLPGLSTFPLLMSSISGYPMGPRLASNLRKDSKLTKLEANRLISFVATSGPLFILGSVGIGMLNINNINFLLIGPHYLSSISIGLIFRFYKRKSKETFYLNQPYKYEIDNKHLQSYDKPISIGKILSNSMKNSINSILLVGGFVIFYSVIIEIILEFKAFTLLIGALSKVTKIDKEIINGILAGFIELTKGCSTIASLEIEFIYKIIIINFIIAWGGMSIHSQSISFISETDINQGIYLFSKMLHGLFTIPYTYIIYKLKYKSLSIPSSTNLYIDKIYDYHNWVNNFTTSLKLSLLMATLFLLISILMYTILKTKKEA